MLILQYKEGYRWDAVFVKKLTPLFGSHVIDLYIRSDGLKLFYATAFTAGNHPIRQVDLSVSWDILSGTGGDGFPLGDYTHTGGFTFKPDGTKYFVVGDSSSNSTERVAEFVVSTPWDVTTTSTTILNYKALPFPLTVAPQMVRFRSDGIKMLVHKPNTMLGFDLSTPWDITTFTADGNQFNFGLPEINYGFDINPAGTRLYLAQRDESIIYRYRLDTPWDVSTIVLEHAVDLSATATDIRAIFLNPSGTKMFLITDSGDAISEYDII